MNKLSITSLLLRIGLAIVFLYAAIASFLDPAAWTVYLPSFLSAGSSANFFLNVFSVIEILLSLWLLSGKKTQYAAGVAAIMLVGIIAANLSEFDIIFRDVGLLFAALALAVMSFGQQKDSA
jgi:uncharacterized membrane protein YphA (DoxX/SURF4 family)